MSIVATPCFDGAMSTGRAIEAAFASALLVAGCAGPPASAPSAPAPAPVRAQRTVAPEAARADTRLPVPAAVARLHRNVFEPSAERAKLGRAICVVTLHDAALKRGEFYPLVLFEGGSVATWREAPNGSEEPFYAKLGEDERARAFQLVASIGPGRGMAREIFEPGTIVMGVSTLAGDRVETLYFDHTRIPAALGELVALLKQRLEETNR